MKKIISYAACVSLLIFLCLAQFSCGKTTEKTTTIIQEKQNGDPKKDADVEFKVKGSGISIDVK